MFRECCEKMFLNKNKNYILVELMQHNNDVNNNLSTNLNLKMNRPGKHVLIMILGIRLFFETN